MCRDLLEFWMLMVNFWTATAYACCAPFLPLEYDRKGIDGIHVGTVFALYSVAIILFSPFVGRVVDYIGYRSLLSVGLCFFGIAFIFFGFIESMEDKVAILTLGYVTRFIQGVASAFC